MLVLSLAACGGDEPDPATPDSTPQAPTQQQGASKAAPAPSRPAPAPAPDPAAAAATELASATSIRTVQVASYMNAATAQAQVAWMQKAGIPVWTSAANVDGQEFTRVRVGVAINGSEARALAERLRSEFHWPVWVLTLDNRADATPAALVASRNWAAGR